jgi:hypothetical protein
MKVTEIIVRTLRCLNNTIIGPILLCLSVLAEDQIIERGPHSNVHQTVKEIVDDGVTKSVTNKFTLLQSGLNYFSETDNEWKASSTEIDLAEVGAEFKKGPFKIKFPPNPKAAALEYTFPGQPALKIQTIGLALTDSTTGESVWLGELPTGCSTGIRSFIQTHLRELGLISR